MDKHRTYTLVFVTLLAGLVLVGCDPKQAPTGVLVPHPAVSNSDLRAATLAFPAGTAVRSRRELAEAIAKTDFVSEAVVVTMDNAAYVAVKSTSQSLSLEQKQTIGGLVQRRSPASTRVYVSDNPRTFAEYTNYARYLTMGRHFQGMYETWRSILRSTPTLRVM